MVHQQLRDELRGVLRGVDSQRLWDHQQGLRKLCDGQLLSRAQRGREGLEVDAQRGLHRAAASHQGLRLQHALHDAQRVVQGAVHLVQHELVGTTQDDGRGAGR